ncbi:MAG TPA: HDOD domain-containing protein [Tepidisphaeraceae bacterium]|jgi:diguanylate cyclase (GGDEF)-like protein
MPTTSTTGNSPRSDYRSKTATLRHEKVSEMLRTLTVLPTAINVPMRIMELYRSSNRPALQAFADVLVADGALSAKVLELANSAWFSRTRTVTRVSDALRMIGLNNLMPLLFGLSLAGIFNRTNLPAEDRASLWQSSLLKAVLAREWVKWRGGGDELSEEAFLCAAIQDIALPVMYAADRAAAMELAGVIDLDEPARGEREASLYVCDHAEFGRQICTQLQLPELYITATATHHAPAGPTLPAQFEPLRVALQLSATVPHSAKRIDDNATRRLSACLLRAASSAPPPSSPAGRAAAASPSVTDAKQISAFVERVSKSTREMMVLLAPPGIKAANMKDFVQEVSDQIAKTMLDAIGTANRTIEQLQAAQSELEARVRELDTQVIQAEYDPLTNVLTRRGFFGRADKMLVLARKLQMGCAVGFIDVNDFKSVNDTHGHDAGDRALVTLSEALRRMMRDRGMVGRCGGDEFAFAMVVPLEAGREGVEKEVEKAVGNLNINTDRGAVHVTCSVGTVWLGVPDDSQNIESALKLADQQMYHTKRERSGGGRKPGPATPPPPSIDRAA